MNILYIFTKCRYINYWASQVTLALLGKNPSASAGNIRDLGLILGSGRFPWKRAWLPTPVFFPEEFHEQNQMVKNLPAMQ